MYKTLKIIKSISVFDIALKSAYTALEIITLCYFQTLFLKLIIIFHI